VPIDNMSEGERLAAMTFGAGAIGWLFKVAIPKVFGMTRARVVKLEAENDRLERALGHALSAIEILLVAMEVPQDRRGAHVERAKAFVTEAQQLWTAPDACGVAR
jgi:hypothetical protein